MFLIILCEAKRSLKICFNEHRNHINRNIIQHSIITEHNHDFDWKDIKILDEGFNKKLI